MTDYSELTRDQKAKLDQYREWYQERHPFPRFWSEMGIEAGALILSAVGSITLSAIRTSTVFMLTEALLLEAYDHTAMIPTYLTDSFPLAAMATSLVAFEGMLAAHGLIRGRSGGRVEVSPVALWSSFAVTIMAGFSASFGLIGLDTANALFAWVTWILAVLTAIGAPVVAYSGAYNLGVILNRWGAVKERWEGGLFASFSGKGGQSFFGVRTTNNPEPSEPKAVRPSSYEREIYDILNKAWDGEHRIPGPTEIANALNLDPYSAKGYISDKTKGWKAERNLQ